MFLFQGNECVLANIEKHKDIDAYDEANCGAIKRFMSIVAEDHFMEFINAQIASQSRDLKLVAGKAGQNAEKEGKSDFSINHGLKMQSSVISTASQQQGMNLLELRKSLILEIWKGRAYRTWSQQHVAFPVCQMSIVTFNSSYMHSNHQ